MLGDLPALGTEDAVRIQPCNQRFEASRVVRILLLELEEGVAALGGSAPAGIVAVALAHTSMVTEACTCGKGIVPERGGRRRSERPRSSRSAGPTERGRRAPAGRR